MTPNKPDLDRIDLLRSVEDCILDVAARPAGLRGPWVMDEDWLKTAAARIKADRRAALSRTQK